MGEPPVPDDAPPPRSGGFLGFLGTIPGVITAIAGLVTAVTGAFLMFHGGGGGPGDGGQSGGSGSGGTTVIVQPAQPPPEGTPQGAPEVGRSLTEVSVDDQPTDVVTECVNGSAGACAVVLQSLAYSCADGYGQDCDDLYVISPVGSSYEDYGATCGGRFGWEYAGRCGAL
jgi:hypothetical protein